MKFESKIKWHEYPFSQQTNIDHGRPYKEAIDPVRYVSNHSSGKMGYAIANALLKKGAQVFLVSGPVCLDLKHPNLKLVKVNSATEMYLACCHF